MARRRYTVEFWLKQIVSFAERLEGHVSGMHKDEFANDPKSVDAASWCIACIGEASGKILETDAEFAWQFPSLELSNAYLARNRYVHGYFDLDAEQVWDTAVVSVPRMAAAIGDLLGDGGNRR